MNRDPLNHGVRVVERTLWILSILIAAAIVAGAVFLRVKMGAGSRSQGGRFYVAIAALVLRGVGDSLIQRLVRRRAPLSLSTTPEQQRYSLASLLVFVISAVGLTGLAWLLP